MDGKDAEEIPTRDPAVPPAWQSSREIQESFFSAVSRARQPLLLCDYDGTLAPFRADKMQAVPYEGVTERLQRLAAGPTRLAFITGRPSAELITLLPLAADTEIWGMHGREHRGPDGRTDLLMPTPEQKAALDEAQARLEDAGLGALLERKIGSVALHWRTLSDGEAERAGEEASEAFAAFAGRHALAVLPFDGGLELRIEDHTKGHALQALVTASGCEPQAAAYLGDDTTDEDAFAALNALGGLSLLVRAPARASAARFHLQPPDALLSFLDQWLAATDAETPGRGDTLNKAQPSLERM